MITLKETPPHERDGALLTRLLRLWEQSVRATHRFLQPADIVALRPCVAEGLASIPVLYVARDSEARVPVAFMGIGGRKIEMLFVSPGHRGTGIGRRLVAQAVRAHGATAVDANEQNPQAVGFYEHLGFQTYARTATDGQGRPFPILQMRLCPSARTKLCESLR